MKMSKQLAEQFELNEKISLLKQIQEESAYQAKGLSADQLSEEAIKKMSRYARYMKDANRTASAITMVGESIDEFHDTAKNEEIAHGFHFGALAVSIYNFFRIPFMYLSAYLLNQPVPFTLSNNSRWLYSALLLSLTITAIAAPVTAPIIAFVSASIGFVASSFFLGKLLYERYKLAREANRLEHEIQIAKKAMEAIQDEAKQLEQQLQEATEEPAIVDICLKIEMLKEKHEPQKKLLEELYEQKLQNEQLKEQFGFKKVVFKSISLILAAATIIGLVVSLFFPPVGLGILAGVAVIGATYLLGRVLAPVFSSFGQWLKNKWSPTPTYEPIANEDEKLLQPEEALHNEKQEKENAKLLEEHLSEYTSEVLRELAETEQLAPKVHHEDIPPVVTPPLFSPKPVPHIEKQKKKESEDEEGESDSEHDQLINH